MRTLHENETSYMNVSKLNVATLMASTVVAGNSMRVNIVSGSDSASNRSADGRHVKHARRSVLVEQYYDDDKSSIFRSVWNRPYDPQKGAKNARHVPCTNGRNERHELDHILRPNHLHVPTK